MFKKDGNRGNWTRTASSQTSNTFLGVLVVLNAEEELHALVDICWKMWYLIQPCILWLYGKQKFMFMFAIAECFDVKPGQ